jgi:hypothetical protein
VKNRWNSRLKHVAGTNAESAPVDDCSEGDDAATCDDDDDVVTPRTQAAAQAYVERSFVFGCGRAFIVWSKPLQFFVHAVLFSFRSRKRTRAHSSPRGFFVEDEFGDRGDVENATPPSVGRGTTRSCALPQSDPEVASEPPLVEGPATSLTASLRALAHAVAVSVHREAERTSAWAASEDKLLSKAVARLGPNAWDAVSKEYFAYKRSPSECMSRYKAVRSAVVLVVGWRQV